MPQLGPVTYTTQMVSTTSYSLEAVLWKTALTVGTVGRIYTPRTGEGVRNLQLLGSTTSVNLQGIAEGGGHILLVTSSNIS